MGNCMKTGTGKPPRGFTLIEVSVGLAVVLILSVLVVHRVQGARANAQAARYQANANQLQSAYERAKVTRPGLLTNENAGLFAANATEAGLMSAELAAEDLAHIVVAPGTSIPAHTARFIVRTNPSPGTDEPLVVAFVQPVSGQTFIQGKPITLAAEAQPPQSIVQVAFADNGMPVQTVYTSPYLVAVNAAIGVHRFSALAADRHGRTASATTEITVLPNHAPSIFWTETTSGAYPAGTLLSLSVIAYDEDPGDRVIRVEFESETGVFATLAEIPFSTTWTGPIGTHQITARAFDANGGVAATPPLQIQLVDNLAPTLSLSPHRITEEAYPDAITFTATAHDTDGRILWVQFYLDEVLVHTATETPYTWTWHTFPGDHEIRAVAQDDGGKSVTRACSASIGTNQRPTVQLTNPASESKFWTGNALTLTAAASDVDGSISVVRFYANGSLLASDTSSPYSTAWMPSAGTYELTAIAVDNQGATRTSAVVMIQVKAAEPLVWDILQSGASISGGNLNGSYRGAASTQTISENGRVEIDVGATAYWAMGLSPSSDPSANYAAWPAGINVTGNGQAGVQRCDVKVPGWSQSYTLFLGGSDTLVLEVVNSQVRVFSRMTDGSIRATTAWGPLEGTLYVHLFNNHLSAVSGVTAGAIYR